MSGSGSTVSLDFLQRFNQMQESGALDDLAALRKENRELEQIIQDAAVLISSVDTDSIFSTFIARMLDHFMPQYLVFIIQPPRGQVLRQYCYQNLKPSSALISEDSFQLLVRFFADRKTAAEYSEIKNFLSGSAVPKDITSMEPELFFPLQGIGGLYGVVILGEKVVGGAYTELEKVYVDRMLRFLSISIQNTLHHESSITDAKTGLFTHDFFLKRIEEEYAHAQRHGMRSGLLILDVDHFKKFNDTYGHISGDEALVALSEVLKTNTRHEDCVARFGGEEFCILVSDCDQKGLFDVAERIRQSVIQLRIVCDNKEVGISVSIGGRMIEGRLGLSARILLDDADHALYRAKSRGRNRTELYSQGFLGMATLVRNTKLAAERVACS